jgi:hypothetical protein
MNERRSPYWYHRFASGVLPVALSVVAFAQPASPADEPDS